MALINCPECGKEISDEAKTCPNCGKPLRKPKEKKKINKKAVIIISAIIVIGIIVVVGISNYRNTPDYVMKQYVKAVNNQDQKLLEKIIYTANQFDVRDIHDVYGGMVAEISSYSIVGEPSSDSIEKFKIIHYKYPEKIDDTISKFATYKIYNVNDWHDWISLACVNGKWKIASCPLLIYKDAS